MWKVHLSRWINHRIFAGKPDQMLSSRLHIENHPAERIVDLIFFWHIKHCKRSHIWEVRHNAQTNEGTAAPSQEKALFE